MTKTGTPNLVKSLTDVEQISCGTDFTVAIAGNSVIYSWGSNKHGQLGQDGSQRKVFTPAVIEEFRMLTEDIVQISCGARHSLFLSAAGEVISCGSNAQGQCGFDKSECVQTFVPFKIAGLDNVDI